MEANIIVTATGFNVCTPDDVDSTIDGKPLNFADCQAHRGILFSGVPNVAWVFGYLRASWNMRSDRVLEFVYRFLGCMA